MGGESGYYAAVRGLLDRIKPGRVMFGTDWPAFSAITPTVHCGAVFQAAGGDGQCGRRGQGGDGLTGIDRVP